MVALRSGQAVLGKVIGIYHPDKKEYRWVLINAVPQYEKESDRPFQVYSIYTDITAMKQAQDEQEKLQTQLLQAHKMESIGRLAGGVAHDFNNMLQTILGNIELTMDELPPGNLLQDRLEEVHKAARRSADLTRQLLAFARKQTIAPKLLDLNDTVSGMLKMLRRLIGEEIELAWIPGADLWSVKIDPAQVDQILANLCVNARDAINGTGRISVETKNIDLKILEGIGQAEFTPGMYVMISVSDNGCGMSADTLEHIFEPFFTTKGIGQGTGLGLATVYGIVKQNEGFINVTSAPGKGTHIKIYLPRHAGEPAESQVKTHKGILQGGKEVILMVEDEEAILELNKEVLERLGYVVLDATRPDEALQKVRLYEGDIDLIITDVVLPGMNGNELAERVREIRPEIKILFMSGYTADVIAKRGVLEEGFHFIQKPFPLQDLASKVRAVLEGRPD
jgi:two-component system, cell cycle sensor histidine kinase and response regulator CckA